MANLAHRDRAAPPARAVGQASGHTARVMRATDMLTLGLILIILVGLHGPLFLKLIAVLLVLVTRR